MPRLPPAGHRQAPQMVMLDEVPVSDKDEGVAKAKGEVAEEVGEVQVNINSVLMHKLLAEDEVICHP